MGKLSNWIKKNILNENQTENTERNEYNIVDEKKGEESHSEIKKERAKEKIYISHMDELFWDAGKLVTEKNRGSASLLQREFKIGFNRACRIMDELCEAGIVGEEIGAAPRKSLISYDEFEELWIDSRIEVVESNIFNNEKGYQKDFVSQPNRIDMYNNKIDYMTGEDFELYVAQMLGRIGFYNIQTTKGSGDQGVDILAEKEGMRYAFQCKRYDKPVGNKAVQEVFAGKFYYHCHVAVVVTNNYFTQSAKDLAHENGVVLWDRGYLQKNIDETSEVVMEKEIEKSPDSVIEKYYYINGDFTTFSLKKENKIEILAICENRINAANLYLSYSVKLKEEWIGKVDFAVAVNFGNAMAICTNENGVEFFGGKELDGEIAIGIPKWMDKARDELLNGNEEEFLRMVEEANRYLDEFMEEAINYIK